MALIKSKDIDKIRALFIFEMLGRPAEHIKEALEGLVDNLGNQKGIEINRRKVHEPKTAEKDGKEIKNLFTTFAEVELTADNLNLIFAVVTNMLPANVEIIEPDELRLKNFDLSSALSELAIKLHRYDEVAKALAIERRNIMNHIKILDDKIAELEKTGEKKKNKHRIT